MGVGTTNESIYQSLIDALARIREKTGKGSDKDFDRESYIHHLWSESDREIYEWCDEALQAAGVAPFEDDRITGPMDSKQP